MEERILIYSNPSESLLLLMPTRILFLADVFPCGTVFHLGGSVFTTKTYLSSPTAQLADHPLPKSPYTTGNKPIKDNDIKNHLL